MPQRPTLTITQSHIVRLLCIAFVLWSLLAAAPTSALQRLRANRAARHPSRRDWHIKAMTSMMGIKMCMLAALLAGAWLGTAARGQCDPQEVAHLFDSDGAAGDQFGLSVAIDGDTAVVGANGDDTPAGGSAGSAYVFVRSGGVWMEQAHLFASDGAPGDFFGTTVAISGDTAVVGAPGDNTPSGTDAGSAYVFVRTGTVWTEQAHLFASDGAANDFFGYAAAISGDTAVVGAAFDEAPAFSAGSAYVFVRSGGVWTEQQHLFASDGAADDQFGVSVAIDGDTAVVGASAISAGPSPGSAYVFVRSGTVWTEQGHLFASDGAAGDLFGVYVAIDGDTAAVGAVFDDTPGGGIAGSAYVFVRSAGVWTEQAHLFASDGATEDLFGASVAISGDTAVVGARQDGTPGGTHAGSAYVFTRNGSVWTEQQHLFASDGAAEDQFGLSAAISGDTAVVGAIYDETPGGTHAGSAYVFDANCGPCLGNIVNTGTSANRVDVDDLLAVITNWGSCPAPPATCPANIVNTGTSVNTVDVDDLLAIITGWGLCP